MRIKIEYINIQFLNVVRLKSWHLLFDLRHFRCLGLRRDVTGCRLLLLIFDFRLWSFQVQILEQSLAFDRFEERVVILQ